MKTLALILIAFGVVFIYIFRKENEVQKISASDITNIEDKLESLVKYEQFDIIGGNLPSKDLSQIKEKKLKQLTIL